MKYEFEIDDVTSNEILRQTLTRVLDYANEEVQGRSTHAEDRDYYRSLSEALVIVLDYFGDEE